MNTPNPEKRIAKKFKGDFKDYDGSPKNSKAKKPQRGRKEFFFDDEDQDQDDYHSNRKKR